MSVSLCQTSIENMLCQKLMGRTWSLCNGDLYDLGFSLHETNIKHNSAPVKLDQQYYPFQKLCLVPTFTVLTH